MRGARAGDPRTSVLLLLALRARGRPVRPPGGLSRAGRRRAGPPRGPATDGLLPRQGRAGLRPPASPDRAARRPRGRGYLYLEEVTRTPPPFLAHGVTT